MHLGIIKITYNWTATHFMEDSFVNLGEEVILTLLWQSGTSESATVCFVISLSICYWLFKCRVLRVVCVCMWERERERERGSQYSVVCVCVCVLACVREGDTVTSQPRLVCKLGMHRSDTLYRYRLRSGHFLQIWYQWDETDPNPILCLYYCVIIKPHESIKTL